jgi:hypothetical protein
MASKQQGSAAPSSKLAANHSIISSFSLAGTYLYSPSPIKRLFLSSFNCNYTTQLSSTSSSFFLFCMYKALSSHRSTSMAWNHRHSSKPAPSPRPSFIALNPL